MSSGNSISGSMGNPIDPNAAKTDAFADLVKAQGQANLMNAQASLALAQADVQEAEAQREQIGNEELQIRVDRLQRQELAIEAAKRKSEIDLKAVNEHLHRVSQMVVEGRTNRWVFYSLRQLLVILNDPALVSGTMGQHVPPEARTPDNFQPNNDSTTMQALQFGDQNLGFLLEVMRQRNLQFVPFLPAHMLIMSVMGSLSQEAAKKAANVQAQIDLLNDKSPAPLPVPGGTIQSGQPGSPPAQLKANSGATNDSNAESAGS